MNILNKICFILISTTCLANSARILAISHINSYSHFIISDRILKELAARGHEVTLITPFEEKTPTKNFRHVVITGLNDLLNSLDKDMFKTINFIQKLYAYHNMGIFLTETVLNNTNVQKLLKSNEKFDLVIHEKFMNDAFSGFSYHFKVPSIIINPTAASHRIYDQMGSINNPSYIRDTFLGLPNDMNFFDRTFNFIVYLTTQLCNEFLTLPKQNEIMQKYFPGSPLLKELFYNTSLVFLNSQASINPPIPLVPNIIEIGGYHVQPPKPLSLDLQEYLDKATDGVIFFSLGSNLKSKHVPEQLRNDILNVFSKLKQKILWKWEDDTIPQQPTNVKLGKWLPQGNILAHPNVKLFITQGGVLSLIESVYYGVPILGLPVFGDQPFNIKNVEYGGYGLGIPYQELTQNTFSQVLNELLTNPKYAENAKRASKIMRDQATHPLDRAVYWIEYVIRHQGAPHLRTSAMNLTWYQYLLLDVVAFLIIVTATALWVFCKVVKLICGSKSKNTVSKNKKTK